MKNEKNQFEMFSSVEENKPSERPTETPLYNDHKIRAAVEQDGEAMTFGNFTGSELLAFREKYRECRDKHMSEYYRAAARALYNDPSTSYVDRFASFEVFFPAISRSMKLMKDEMEIEIAKREIAEEAKVPQEKKPSLRSRRAA